MFCFYWYKKSRVALPINSSIYERNDITRSPAFHYKMLHEITYPFSNFNGVAVEAWEWWRNFTQHFTGHAISYSCWN